MSAPQAMNRAGAPAGHPRLTSPLPRQQSELTPLPSAHGYFSGHTWTTPARQPRSTRGFWTASSSSRASITANQAISKPDVMKGLSRVSKPAACGLRTRIGVPATPSASEHLPKQALHPVRELHL